MSASQEKLIIISGSCTVKIGSKLTLNRAGENVGLGLSGDIAEVKDIILRKGRRLLELTRHAGPHPAWNGHQTEFCISDIIAYFDSDTSVEEKQYCVIKTDVIVKKRNLKGLRCEIITQLEDGNYFVEFEEDVGGCSCDGLGRRGHCIVVSAHSLTRGIKSKKMKGGVKTWLNGEV
jgi:hypothetical protein